MGEGCVGRDGEPVAHGLPVNRRLLFQVVRDLRDWITFGVTFIIRYSFIPTGEHHRLKNNAVNLVYPFCCKADDITQPIVVQPVHHGHLERSFHSRGGDVVQCGPLHVHIVPDSSMAVLCFRGAIELEIHRVESSRPCLGRKIPLLGKANSISGDMNPVEAHAFCMADGLQENR